MEAIENTVDQTQVVEALVASMMMPLPEPKEMQFKLGWPYGLWLSKNSYSPSEERGAEWRALCRAANRQHADEMHRLSVAGCKTSGKARAVFNGKDKRWDTSMTMRVVKPGCDDTDLIREAVIRMEDSSSKRLANAKIAARAAGAIV